MTAAICFHCGKTKFGALTTCGVCGSTPSEEDDIALSMALSDHYHTVEHLEVLGWQIANGKRLILDQKTKDTILVGYRSAKQNFGLQPTKGNTSTTEQTPPPPKAENPFTAFWGTLFK